MPLLDTLRSLLDSRHLPYSMTKHRTTFRAREMASVEHLPAREVAKTVVVYGDAKFHLIAVPAHRHVDMHELRDALNLRHVRLATEAELAKLFPDCELGAMPPVGILFNLSTYLDSELAGESMITFSGGTHQDSFHMRTDDFRALTHPKVVSLTQQEHAAIGW